MKIENFKYWIKWGQNENATCGFDFEISEGTFVVFVVYDWF